MALLLAECFNDSPGWKNRHDLEKPSKRTNHNVYRRLNYLVKKKIYLPTLRFEP